MALKKGCHRRWFWAKSSRCAEKPKRPSEAARHSSSTVVRSATGMGATSVK